MASQARRFVKCYGTLAWPLTDLLKTDNFCWTPGAQSSFDELKKAMLSAPVLALPDFTKMFDIECDASGFGISAVLMHDSRLIAYFSRGLTAREQLKPIYERELMAVVLATRKWKHNLLGRRFFVHTDQKSLKFLLEQRDVSMEYQKWLIKLLGYEFDIVYKPGIQNKAAYGLSHIEHQTQEVYTVDSGNTSVMALTVPTTLQLHDLLKEIADTIAIHKLSQRVKEGTEQRTGFKLHNGKLWYKGKLFIPSTSSFIPTILHECHDGLQGMHSGDLKTLKRIQQ